MEEYGKAMVNLEIAQGRVNHLKQLIQQELTKKQDEEVKIKKEK